MLKSAWLAGLLSFFMSQVAVALPAVVKIYQRCDVDVPLRDGYVLLLNMKDQFFLPTDHEGNLFLDDEHQGKSLMVYLSNADHTIFAGCRSDIIPTPTERAVMRGLCPSRNCY